MSMLSWVKSKPFLLITVITVLQLCVALLSEGFSLSFDESMWHYIGRNWFRHGLAPYDGGVDNKSPLIFLFFGVSDALFGVNYWFPRIIGVLCQAVSVYYVYRICIHLSGKTAGHLAILIYGFALMWRVTGGKYAAHTETFEMTLVIISFYKFFTADKKKDLLFSGFMGGLALAFRYSAFFALLAVFISLARRNRGRAIYFLLGSIAGFGIFLISAAQTDIDLNELYIYSFADNFSSGSITDYSPLWKVENFADKFFQSELVLFYPAMLGYFFIPKRNAAILMWLVFEFTGINLVGLYATQHFKDILPVLAITNALCFAYLVEHYKIPAGAVFLIVGLCFFPKRVEPFVVLKNVFNKKEEMTVFGEGSKKKLGLWIKSNTSQTEKVLILGNGAQVQVYSERLSPALYFNNTATTRAKKQFFHDLETTRAKMILIPVTDAQLRLVDKDIKNAVDILIRDKYHLKQILYGYAVYELT